MISVASCSRKRPNEFISDTLATGPKLQKTEFYFVLESSDSDLDATSDTESMNSIQNKSTDFAKDTSDTSSKTSRYETDRESLAGLEYEVVSLSSDNEIKPFASNSSGTDSDSWRRQWSRGEEEECTGQTVLADSSSAATEQPLVELPLPLKLRKCLRCKAVTNWVQYCNQCFKVRKDFFPPRPKGRKLRNTKNTYRKKVSSKEIGNIPVKDSEVTSCSSQELTPEVPSTNDSLCNVCCKNPKNGAFLHCRWVHIYACYQCSIKIWFTSKSCPLCHGKIRTVLKVADG